MKKQNQRVLGTVLILTMLFLPGLAASTTYYVDDGGSDGNNGLSAGTPWKTIIHAAGNISGGTAAAPDILMVAAGTYDQAANGEVFPITFTGNYINLVGNSAASVIIDTTQPDTSTRTALQVNGKGVNVSGFTFRNADDGIAFTKGGFTVTNSVFAATVDRGVSLSRNDVSLSSSVSHGDMSITNNTFRTSLSGVEVQIQQIFDGVTGNLTAAIGSLSITGNTFAVSGNGIIIPSFFISKLFNGTATVGDITVSNNNFTGGDMGVNFVTAMYGELEDTRLTTGDTVISNNTFTDQQSDAIFFGTQMVQNVSGSSLVVLGGLTVQDNSIASDPVANPGAGGIFTPMYQVNGIKDDSTVSIADLAVKNNSVSVGDAPLFLQGPLIVSLGQQYWSDTVKVTTGSTTVSDNILTSAAGLGIHVQYISTGSTLYGLSKVTRGSLSITRNIVQAGGGMGCMIMEVASGNNMFEDSSLLMKEIDIRNNIFTSTTDMALFINRSNIATGLQDNSSVTAQSLSISKNTLISPSFGIFIDDGLSGAGMEDKASFTRGDVIIDSNIIKPVTSAGMASGIRIITSDVGSNNRGQISSTVGDIGITNNKMSAIADRAVDLQFSGIGASNIGAGRVAFGDINISDNTLDTVNGGTSVQLLGLNTGSGTSLTVGELNISSNTMTGISGFGVYSSYQAHNNAPDTATFAIGAIHIDDNIISGTAATNNGIFLDVNTPTPGVSFGSPVLSGNSVIGFQSGIHLSNNVKRAELQCNTLENNVVAGLYLESDETFTAMNNAFVGNGKGLQVSGARTAVVTAENNWWGDAAGPVACTGCNKIDAGGGSVDYDPWLTAIYRMQCSKFSWPMFMPAFTGNRR